MFGLLLYGLPHTLVPSWFTPNNDAVIQQTAKLIPLLSIYMLGDGTRVAIEGVLNGCGRQRIGVPVVIFSYWVVGVPLAYYIVFVRHGGYMCEDGYLCGVVGLVIG